MPNSGNKHSHRSKAHQQSNLSHGKHDTNGLHGRSGAGLNTATSSSSSQSASQIPSERTKGKYNNLNDEQNILFQKQ